MLDAENPAEAVNSPESSPETGSSAESTDAATGPAKKAPAKRAAAKKATAKKATAKRTAKKAAAAPDGESETEAPPAAKKAAKKSTAKRGTKKAAATAEAGADSSSDAGPASGAAGSGGAEVVGSQDAQAVSPPTATALLFQPPDPTKAVTRPKEKLVSSGATDAADDASAQRAEVEKPATKKASKKPSKKGAKDQGEEPTEPKEPAEGGGEPEREEGDEEPGGDRRRRRRGGRRRRKSGAEDGEVGEGSDGAEGRADSGGDDRSDQGPQADESDEGGAGGTRRRRRRRRGEAEGSSDDADQAPSRSRKSRSSEDEITALSGSTRLEAKKQRRREGREAGRRRAPIVSEAEFLARRESVDRVMVIRQREDLTQIAVLEDKVLVEHYVARESQTSLIGNVYLGRVQNVLPSMEAAFIDIGKGRNAVLYAGEVNWDALGAKNGSPRKIESVLQSGQSILVQVTKDPVGHKGARLTSQISLPGRFLVYVPDGTTSGISRKLPDTERNRLKNLLKEIVPDSAGVIVRTAAEGASEDELTRDVERLTARWADIESKVQGGNAPQLLYGEPDLTLKVVRDLFTEDFKKLVISGADAWDLVDGYVSHVAPDLGDRLERYDGERDVFAEYRIDEQIEKALDRKVWLPSGGSLVIDRTEAMTVVDVNTGKFTGSGGNLEETVTKNNLEAAEEIVRQLRLRDIGGIIVVDFIDMVLESNRDLVLRRLVECLGRDRTRHQVAEVTSLGLVQMTRKRIGTGLLEAFSESCEHCQGRGLILHHEPVEPKRKSDDDSRRGRRGGRARGRDEAGAGSNGGGVPSPKDLAAMAKHEEKTDAQPDAQPAAQTDAQPAAQTDARTDAQGERPAEARPEPSTGPESTQTLPETSTAEAASGSQDAGAPSGSPDARSSGRTRGGRGRGGRGRVTKATHAPAEAPVPEMTSEPTLESAPVSPEAPPAPAAEVANDGHVDASQSVATEPESAEPVVPAAPKIVTSVRRRGARRPAGPPPGLEEAQSQTSEADGSGEEQVTDEPADTEPLAALVDAAEVEGAGGDIAEADAAAVDTAGVDGAGVDGADAKETAASTSTPHVPVKRRGSRRR